MEVNLVQVAAPIVMVDHTRKKVAQQLRDMADIMEKDPRSEVVAFMVSFPEGVFTLHRATYASDMTYAYLIEHSKKVLRERMA